MKRATQGIAMVVVLLFTVLILTSIVITASISSLSSRITTSGERQSYQALLAAESGLNSFVVRVAAANYQGGLFGFPCWVQGRPVTGADACTSPATRNIAELQLEGTATGPRATIDILALDSANKTVTVRSTGSVPGNATKAVLLDYLVDRRPAANVAAPGALTSCPEIRIQGNSTITGYGAPSTANNPPAANSYNGTLPNITTFRYFGTNPSVTSGSLTRSTSYPATINVADAALFTVGSFLKFGNSTFTVNEKTGTNRLTISPVPDSSTVPAGGISLNSTSPSPTQVDLVPVAIRAPVSLSGSGWRIPANDPTGFFVQDVIYIVGPAPANINYAATIFAKGYTTVEDFTTGYVDVNLSVSAGHPAVTLVPSVVPLTLSVLNTLPIGTPVLRYVPSATSTNAVNTGGGSNTTPNIYGNNAVIQCGDALFQQIFSESKDTIRSRVTPTTTFPIPVTRGVHWVVGDVDLTAGALCGNGIVIITGSLTFNGTCTAGFSGVLYVMGNLSAQGNFDLRGAVVVEGVTRFTQTSVAGTNKITYDLRAILDSGRDLSPLTLQSVQGTWRQQ